MATTSVRADAARRATRQRPPDVALSARVVQLRAATGCTQAEMATMANVAKQVITRVERAAVTPDLRTVLGLARAFGASVNWLATGHGPIFADAPAGIVALAKPSNAHAVHAAVQLVGASSEPLRFALIESAPPEREAGQAIVGGVFWQRNWLAMGRCGVIMPRPLSVYDRVGWLSAWVSAGHVWCGVFALPEQIADELTRLSPGCHAEHQVSREFWQWLKSLPTRPPDRVECPEIGQVRAMLPAAQVERLEETIRVLKDGGVDGSDARELVSLIQRHPEPAPRLSELARWLLANVHHDERLNQEGRHG